MMRLSKILEMVEDLLGETTYGYQIVKVVAYPSGINDAETDGCIIEFQEMNPDGSLGKHAGFKVEINQETGLKILNSNNDNVVDLIRKSNDTDAGMQRWIRYFSDKWNIR